MSTMFLIMTAVICANVKAETFRAAVQKDGFQVKEDIVVDRENNLMTVNVGSVSKIPGACSTINLHDFNKGVLAMKNVDSGDCIVAIDDETLSETLETLERYKRYHLAITLKKTRYLQRYPMTPEETLEFGGAHIAKFCEGYKTYRGKDSRTVNRSISKRGLSCTRYCVFCLVSV